MLDLPDLKIPGLHAKGPRAAAGDYPTLAASDRSHIAYKDDEDEFIQAVSKFRTVNKVSCPTLCQMLWIMKRLGYSKQVQWVSKSADHQDCHAYPTCTLSLSLNQSAEPDPGRVRRIPL